MADIRVNNLKNPIDVAEYMFRRLAQIGVKSVHGVPGDYNLVALDYLPRCGLTWVGSVNELNAAYAADGYARVNKIGTVVTTFGVGELSAINGIAGAYAEHIPVVHIVGCPSTASQMEGTLLHHTLGNGDFHVFSDMSTKVVCNKAQLMDPSTIACQIDHALRECFVQSRPVYIMLPTDMVQTKIEGSGLGTPIDLAEPVNEPEKEQYVVNAILEQINQAKRPKILVDACALRHNVLNEVLQLVDTTGMPVYVTPMGKGAVNEHHPQFRGVYAGAGSIPLSIREEVESSDLLLSIGALKSDFNTTGFSYRTSQLRTIDFHRDRCVIGFALYPNVDMKGVLKSLIPRLDRSAISRDGTTAKPNVDSYTDDSYTITHGWLWPRISEFLEEDDIVITETGTANFGIWQTIFPKGAIALNQILWGSIGWSVGACQGAALAARDAKSKRRTILFIGDGSLQLTVQELSTMLRLDLKPIIFVICNQGFTIERHIHGMDATYNDVNTWRHSSVLDAFSNGAKWKSYDIKTKKDLEALFIDPLFYTASCLQIVDLHMSRDDAPTGLITTANSDGV